MKMTKIFTAVLLFMASFLFAQDELEPKIERNGEITTVTFEHAYETVASKRTLSLNMETNTIDVVFYYEDGQISQTGFYTLDGKLQGNWYSYDTKGEKTVAAKYDKGNKVGKWFYWDDKTLKEVDYNSNEIVNVIEWSNDKTLVSRD